jgi:hypothetical protein
MNKHTKETIDNYINHGLDGGGFIRAVITNDLLGAISCGDSESIRDLKEITSYCFNRIPAEYYGSVEAYHKRLEARNNRVNEGCPDCGLGYSFFFNRQFHKKGCRHAE